MPSRPGYLASSLLFVLAAPLHAQSTCSLDWALEETLRIGSLDGDDALEWVPDIAIDPETREIYVPQSGRGEVLVFSDSGALLRQIGREGSGPGDFESGPRSVAWVDGELWVADAFRAQSFGGDGRPKDFVSFESRIPHEGVFYRPEAPLADGTYWARRWDTTMRDPPQSPRTLTLRRYDREGVPVDTIGVLDTPDRRIVTNPESGGFAAHPLWRSMPGSRGLADMVTSERDAFVLVDSDPTGSPDSFDLLRLSLTGDTLMHRRIAWTPIPISREERDWWFTEFAASMAGDYTVGRSRYLQKDEATRNRMRRQASGIFWLPDHYPPVRRVLAGSDGSIWLLREFSVLDRRDRWEIYSRDGALVGHLAYDGGRHPISPWDSRVDILAATIDELWATSTDQFEVPYIHRYRIDRGCSPG